MEVGEQNKGIEQRERVGKATDTENDEERGDIIKVEMR